MGKSTTIEIFHENNPNATYLPGQLMRGVVVLHNAERLELRETVSPKVAPKISSQSQNDGTQNVLYGMTQRRYPYPASVRVYAKARVRVQFKGDATVRWSEGSGKNRRTYWNHETYFNSQCVVFGNPASSSEKTELGVGDHSYPFQFQLPPGIPMTFEGAHGRVTYNIAVTVDKPWAFDVTLALPFFVLTPLDLNLHPDALSEAKWSQEKFICCWCCKSGPLSASIHVPRKGYVAGDTIRVFSEMQNLSSRNIKQCCVVLNKCVKFHATSKTRTVGAELCRVQGPELPPGGSHHFHGETLTVPQGLEPSFLLGCNIIDIQYYVTAVMDPAGPAFDLNAPVEVIIGNIPHAMAAGAEMGVGGVPRPFGTTDVPAQPMPGLSPAFAQQQYGITQQPNATTQQYGMTQQYGGMELAGGGSNNYSSAFDYGK